MSNLIPKAMSSLKYYIHNQPLELEQGECLEQVKIAYTINGTPKLDGSNVVWVCHAFTANSNPIEWWPGLVGGDAIFNENEHCIICANILGSPYGSTSPLDVNHNNGNQWLQFFPKITIRDIVNSFEALRTHLGIQKIHTLIGGSMGGFQALEWSIQKPDLAEHLILIATSAYQSPWAVAFNESQRMVIKADRTFFSQSEEGGKKGLAAARSVALLSYRNYHTYSITQSEQDNELKSDYRAASYQRYQGEKLIKRFNAFSYMTLLDVMDSHNVGRGRNGVESALQQVQANTLVIGIDSDIKFPVSEQELLSNHIPNSHFEVISSEYGHDGFIIETKKITEHIASFYNDQAKQLNTLKTRKYEYKG